jgi:hypothetical protein
VEAAHLPKKATNLFNRSLSRSSNRDRVSYSNIPPSTACLPPTLSADQERTFHLYTCCNPLYC